MPENAPSRVLLEWQTVDSRPHERSARWYLVGGIFVIAFAVYGLLEKSWTTTLLALLIGAMYFLLRNVKPRTIIVQITGLGVNVAGTFTPWNMLRDFWILVAEKHTELHLAPSRSFKGEIVVFVEQVDAADVRNTLLQFLPERTGMEERMLDYLARILKL